MREKLGNFLNILFFLTPYGGCIYYVVRTFTNRESIFCTGQGGGANTLLSLAKFLEVCTQSSTESGVQGLVQEKGCVKALQPAIHFYQASSRT